MARKWHDEAIRLGGASVKRVDDVASAVRGVEIPEDMQDGVAHVAAVLVDDNISPMTRIKLAIAYMKNLYRAGYANGQSSPISKIGRDC